MDHPLLLLFGMIAISTLLFALTRSLCRDPELLQVDVERERQRVLAEAVVRHMDTHELVAIASGRLGAPGSLLARRGSSTRSGDRSDADQTTGVSQETRTSFIKMLAGRGGHAPTHEISGPPVASIIASDDNDEEKSRQLNSSDVKSEVTGERLQPLPSAPTSLPEGAGLPSRPMSLRCCVVAGLGGEPQGEASAAEPEESAATLDEPSPGDLSGGVYSDNSCSVCLDEYVEGDKLLRLTCGHVFHRSCIDLWLKGHCVCPCCRTDLDKLAQVAQMFPAKSRRSLQKALNRADGNAMVAIELLLSRRDRRNSNGGDAIASIDRSSDVDVGSVDVVARDDITDVSAQRDGGGGGGLSHADGVISSISARFRRSGSGRWGGGGNRTRSGSRSGSSDRQVARPTASSSISSSIATRSQEVLGLRSDAGAPAETADRDVDIELGDGYRAGEAGAAAGAAAAATAAAVVAATSEPTAYRVFGPSARGVAEPWESRQPSIPGSATDVMAPSDGDNIVTPLPLPSSCSDCSVSMRAAEEGAVSRLTCDPAVSPIGLTRVPESSFFTPPPSILASSPRSCPFSLMNTSSAPRSREMPFSAPRSSSLLRFQTSASAAENDVVADPAFDPSAVVRAMLARAEERGLATPLSASAGSIARSASVGIERGSRPVSAPPVQARAEAAGAGDAVVVSSGGAASDDADMFGLV